LVRVVHGDGPGPRGVVELNASATSARVVVSANDEQDDCEVQIAASTTVDGDVDVSLWRHGEGEHLAGIGRRRPS
jgi:hypothetical protein